MKFTLSWLKDYLETDSSLDDILETLTSVGLEVEDVQDSAKDFAPFRVAYVESAEQHPDADRLKVCQVKTQDGMVQVVCGAPNARAGMHAVFAPSGSYIPGLDVTLKKSKIRGVESNGMLVSEKEMCLSEDHNGIIDLDTPHEIGTPMTEIYGMDDVMIDIGLTPNRADCAGIYGIARDLAAAGLGTLKAPDTTPVKESFKTDMRVDIHDDGNACRAFYGREIRGVKNGQSPEWFQNRLKAIGLRPISALVDITNYMTMAFCRPLHVYDMARLSGNIHVRFGKKGEEFDALNDKSYKVDDTMCVIADDSGMIGLGGIVGGVSTGCEEDSTNIFLECAYFDPAKIAKTGRKLQVISDARYRFERGVDPEFLNEGVEIATKLILEFCGGEVSDIIKTGEVPSTARQIDFAPNKTRKLGGIDIAEDKQEAILNALGFGVEKTSQDQWRITPPSWRGDIDGSADIVEEVLRIHGLDNIEAISIRPDDVAHNMVQPASYLRVNAAQKRLASRGLQECVTWSFMNEKLADQFLPEDKKVDTQAITLTNPISEDLSRMRTSILPNLINALKRNQDRGYGNAALFETGPVFFGINPEDTQVVASGARHSVQGSRHWSSSEANRPVDAFDAKADALAAIDACGGPAATAQITNDAPHWYHPGRSGSIRLGKNVLAHFGEIHPAILEDIDIQGPVCGFEVFLENLPHSKNKATARKLLKLSPLQPVHRDFAFLVEQDVKADSLVRAIIAADKNLIDQVDVFDVYQGKGVDENEKSVAVNVRIQPKDVTLRDEDLEALSKKIIDTVANKTGGRLRA